jgi:two-component system sensor histidine kinase KdpD
MMLNPINSSQHGNDLAEQIKAHAGALMAVAVATLAGLVVAQTWGPEPVVLLYILPVLAAAIYGGLRPALTAAISSTLVYNYFFTAPYHTLMIHSPADVVTVVILFLVALVTSRLASQVRDQARLAAAHAARNATIAGFARQLLTCASEAEIAQATVSELAAIFSCNAVFVANGDAAHAIASAPGEAALAPSDLAAAALTLASGQPSGRGIQRLNLVDWHFRPIASSRDVLAAAGLAREDGTAPFSDSQLALLTNLLDQVALALERAKLEGDARDVVKLRERDKIRSNLLTSIGEDVKPRLLEISAAARDLKREGLGSRTLISGLIDQAGKLDHYIDSLVNLGPGNEPPQIKAGDLMIDLHHRKVFKGADEVHHSPKEFALLAELGKHQGRVLGHSHLLRAVWGPAHSDQVDYLRVAVRSLRKKLEPDPNNPGLILNEPAVGYRLKA